jgi:3-hydroxybutyryl-CoA dehydrogenase
MGPFELMDLVGIDVNLAAARGVWEGFDRAERFHPSPIQERLVEEERLGRKTGRGFYRYEDGRRTGVDQDQPTGAGADPAEIARRIELAVIAEAWRALGDAIATRDDIDLAMRLGAGHRVGPFERTAEFGGPLAVADELESLREKGARFAVPANVPGSRQDA